jgi:hypothetical protein
LFVEKIKSMRQIITCLLVFGSFFSVQIQAQIGISPYFSTSQAPYFQEEKGSESFQQFGAAIHYWMRLKNIRIEFYPELGYATGPVQGYQETISTEFDFVEESMNAAWFRLPIRFYPLDFTGDCDCPTFSKQGNLVKKGFFLSLVPGVRWIQLEGNTGFQNNGALETPVSNFTRDGLSWSAGIGAGLDIGISDALTITPQVLLERTGDIEMDQIPCQECPDDMIATPFTIFSAGLSIHYRWRK